MTAPSDIKTAAYLFSLVKQAADLKSAVAAAVQLLPAEPNLVLGGGKAGRTMVEALSIRYPSLIGAVAVPVAHAGNLGGISLLPAEHPLPGENSVSALDEMEALLHAEPGPVLFLLSGGASAMLGAPLSGLSLGDWRAATQALLSSGLAIEDMNCIRRHVTRWGGGKLAAKISSSAIVWVVSDVFGDDLATIGSGPLAPDRSTFQDAVAILARFDDPRLEPVLTFCRRGAAGEIAETRKPGDPVFNRIEHRILISNRVAVDRLAAALLPMPVRILPPQTGPIEEVARAWADRLAGEPAVYIAGGEPTVQLGREGRGGRNQHLALSVAAANRGGSWLFLSVATDGVDGNSTNAGAWMNTEHANRHTSEISDALNAFESATLCERLGIALPGGPTGTNVADIQIGIAQPSRVFQ